MSDPEASNVNRQLKILSPPKNTPSIPELPESAYRLDNNELKKLYQSSIERREKLENSPLKTQKMRDAEEQEKLKKHPKTTIRVRMPDHTIIQATFQSKEKISDLYEFIRTLLETPERKFVLCLPPRTKLIDPMISLYKAGLSPASNILFGWIEKGNNDSGLKKEFVDMKQELSLPSQATESSSQISASSSTSSSSNQTASNTSTKKAVPKWLQKGLFNKK
ncbi:hypothetical protein G6F57_009661 [Rhizopus arrhizus]|uniref:UBX domain-containing protein n=1 Tax=Rhizopus oryzae TaxID=64495 RepID=A0A9P6XIY6_RHIOR|nr:hypothetical protein G6F30_009308 [Rhizopus arrhizus]KAG1417605.1 hypothetical protein G6F58_005434 [Rhizopus delemar]KAG0975162.1 hypothetical protein G6F29_011725 [Rhizopus arrhizus]KAG0990909.1 hypothetical protein G6F28_009094 [Rhizopus arrhizus]KAG1011560.1 hypothetical protein G6F27_003636 [Rhizopus arrhizus]